MGIGVSDIFNLWNLCYKKRRSTIPPVSTKQTITTHLKSLNINKTHKSTFYVGFPCPSLG
jgi:hypothetical protein